MFIRWSFFNNLIGVSLAACLLSVAFGHVGSWTSPVFPKLRNNTSDNPFNKVLTQTQESWMSSIVNVGAAFGCWFFGAIATTFGRRIGCLSLGAPVLIGYLLMIVYPKVEIYYIARFIQGCSIGGGYNLSLTYLGEISTKKNRGTVITVSDTFVGVGTIFCYALGSLSVTKLNLAGLIFPIIFLAIGFLFCEESPYFYLMQNDEEQAEIALRTYRIGKYDNEEEMKDMKDQIRAQNEGCIFEILKTKGYKKAFIIGAGLLLGQQLTGNNAVVMYSQMRFDATGLNLSPEFYSLVIAFAQVFGGALTPLIVDKLGRKPILYISGCGMIISEIILGVYCMLKDSGRDLSSINLLPIFTTILFIFSYNFGFGPICWLVSGEILPTRVKLVTLSILITIYNGIGFLIEQCCDTVVDAIGFGFVFLIHACCCFSGCLFIKLFVIETKELSLEEIQDILNGVEIKEVTRKYQVNHQINHF